MDYRDLIYPCFFFSFIYMVNKSTTVLRFNYINTATKPSKCGLNNNVQINA